MKKVPIVVVDDSDADRYIVKRRLSKAGGFAEIMEASDGVSFLEEFFNGNVKIETQGPPLLVLMDVNMPGMNGFETIEELETRVEAGKGPSSMIIMMFTSSSNPEDLALAEKYKSIRGYIHKPLDEEGIQKIRSLYSSYYSS